MMVCSEGPNTVNQMHVWNEKRILSLWEKVTVSLDTWIWGIEPRATVIGP